MGEKRQTKNCCSMAMRADFSIKGPYSRWLVDIISKVVFIDRMSLE